MTYPHVIAIDQGTYSTRAIIYNQLGESVFKAQQPVNLFYSENNNVEQNGIQILDSCKAVLHEAHAYVQQHKLKNLTAALATQRSTVIAWDSTTGEALSPALSWLDTRAQNELHALKLNSKEVKARTGLPISAHYGASKLRWLLEQHQKVKHARQKNNLLFGPLAAFLIFNLLEDRPACVDNANAHRTLLWNLQTRNWDDYLLAAFSIDSSLLPKVVPNSYDYGKLSNVGYLLTLVNGDQNSAVYGYGALKPHTTIINIGTGGFVLANSNNKPLLDSKLLASITYSSDVEQEYALEGTINGAGAALTWAEEAWGICNIGEIPWHDVDDVPIFINSVGGLGSPWWKSDLSPEFVGVHKSHLDYTKQQCKAALMESIVFLIATNVEEINKHGIQSDQLIVSGGLSADSYLCQRIADLCGVPVTVSGYKEATSRGAAWLAMDRPKWEMLETTHYEPNKDAAISARYQKFKMEIQRRVQ